ncbi:MAG: hypothetical protein N2749_00830 [Clostridia bacterium]|nr:hypothetical protein [Clostridia bacterium]
MKRKIINNTLNIIIFIICLIAINAIFYFNIYIYNTKTQYISTIKKEWRIQAKRTLIDLKDQFLLEAKLGKLNPHDEREVQEWAMININGVRNGGETGDPFLIRMPDEKFIWDGSPDCAKPEFLINGRYMKDEPYLHKNPSQAEKMLNNMRKLYSTTNGDYDNYWEFDDSPELLEWIIIPNDNLGFDNEPITKGGIKNKNYISYILVLGTQTDEIMELHQPILKRLDLIQFILKIILVLFIIMVFISLMFVINYVNNKY